MAYSVPQHIDPNQIFLVNFSELEGRWDPYFYKPDYFNKKRLLKNNKFIQIKNILLEWNRGDGPREGFYTDDVINGVYFIRINNMQNHSVVVEDIKYINRIVHETKLKRAQVKPGDLIFAISGTKENLGTVSIVPDNIKEANLNSAIVKLKIDETQINKYFFCYLFDLTFIRLQIDYIGKGAAQNNLNKEEVGQIFIPLFPMNLQMLIVDKLNNAAIGKDEKLIQSRQKLASIDEYLLGELGITLPKNDFQELKDRLFAVRFKEVVCNRLDPFYYLVSGKKVTSTSFANTQLKDIANIVKGNSITSDAVNKNGQYPVIAGGQTSPYNHDQYNFGGNVISISASGAYSGYVWYHEKPIFASDCSVIYSKDETKFLTRYIFEVLKLQQPHIYNLQQGAGQPHVYPEDLGKLIIPEVPLDKQTEIVAHISAIRAEAKTLEVQAEEVLTKAREEVEKMIMNKA